MSRTQAAGRKRLVKAFACQNRECRGAVPIEVARENDGASPVCPACGGRTQRRKRWMQTAKGLVNFEPVKAEMARKGVIFKGGRADQAPSLQEARRGGPSAREHDRGPAQAPATNLLHRPARMSLICAGIERAQPHAPASWSPRMSTIGVKGNVLSPRRELFPPCQQRRAPVELSSAGCNREADPRLNQEKQGEIS